MAALSGSAASSLGNSLEKSLSRTSRMSVMLWPACADVRMQLQIPCKHVWVVDSHEQNFNMSLATEDASHPIFPICAAPSSYLTDRISSHYSQVVNSKSITTLLSKLSPAPRRAAACHRKRQLAVHHNNFGQAITWLVAQQYEAESLLTCHDPLHHACQHGHRYRNKHTIMT